MTWNLFLDDERYPPKDGQNWAIARTMEDVLMYLRQNGMPSFISFDHDLGDKEPTGYDIAKFLVGLDMSSDNDYKFSKDFSYYVHSQNPVGKANIEGYLDNYMRVRYDTAY